MLPGMKALLNYHPMLVHFPIALWLAALFFEVLAAWKSSDDFHRTAVRLLYLGTVGGFLAMFSGLTAQSSVEPAREIRDVLAQHELLMIIATNFALGLCIFAFFIRKRAADGYRKILLVALLILASLVVFGADRGGFLVFHYGQSINSTTSH
jgi:uncharacterized membrane protein